VGRNVHFAAATRFKEAWATPSVDIAEVHEVSLGLILASRTTTLQEALDVVSAYDIWRLTLGLSDARPKTDRHRALTIAMVLTSADLLLARCHTEGTRWHA
jgi:hypothetical protein